MLEQIPALSHTSSSLDQEHFTDVRPLIVHITKLMFLHEGTTLGQIRMQAVLSRLRMGSTGGLL